MISEKHQLVFSLLHDGNTPDGIRMLRQYMTSGEHT